jgi:hypothetical protein
LKVHLTIFFKKIKFKLRANVQPKSSIPIGAKVEIGPTEKMLWSMELLDLVV